MQLPILEARDINVTFKIPTRRFGSFKEFALSKLRREKNEIKKFHALSNVSIEAFNGECVGILGHNGSGKSTLLKVVAGILSPQSGSVRVEGRITSLIELGAGFDPELNAEDNIYLSCALMGISKAETKEKLEEIIEFAGLQDFRDFPIKNYSSGMYARLGFSCATTVDPSTILVDEVISVGDEAFQEKCYLKLQELRQKGKCVVFVSHSMDAVEQFCSRVYVLDKGNLIYNGDTAGGIAAYRNSL